MSKIYTNRELESYLSRELDRAREHEGTIQWFSRHLNRYPERRDRVDLLSEKPPSRLKAVFTVGLIAALYVSVVCLMVVLGVKAYYPPHIISLMCGATVAMGIHHTESMARLYAEQRAHVAHLNEKVLELEKLLL